MKEIKVEIVCAESRVAAAVEILRSRGHSSRASGWAYVIDIEQAIRLDA